jgi:death-on-curing protein
MTAENPSSLPTRYLDRSTLENIHRSLSEWSNASGEPVPPFSLAKEADIEALLDVPQRRFFGFEAYPSLADKAAIIFYTINKRQIFLNGNKRMSTLCLLVFLGINGYYLSVADGELTEKALWLAQSDSIEFQAVKTDLVAWIGANIKPIPKLQPGA